MKLFTTPARLLAAGLLLFLPRLSEADSPRNQVTAIHPGVTIAIRALSLDSAISLVGHKAGARLTMRVGLNGPRPAWWGKTGVTLTGFCITDRQGKQIKLKRDYYGSSEPMMPSRDDCLIRYTLPIPRENIAELTCIIVKDGMAGKDTPLAKVTVR